MCVCVCVCVCVCLVCLCVCVCVCVFSVCVCVCVCVCVYPKRYSTHGLHSTTLFTLLSHFTSKFIPYTFLSAMGSKPKTTRAKIHEPQGKAIIFDFPLSGTTTFSNFWTFSTFLIFCFWFLSLVSCLPADEATAKLDIKLSIQFGQQTA